MSNINHIVSDRRTGTFKIIDNNGDDVLEIDSSNELKIGRGANKTTLVSNAGVPNVGGGGGGGAQSSLELGTGVVEAPIIINLPCQYSEFPNPTIDGLILTVNQTGRVRPIGDGDSERTIVIGVSTEPVVVGQTSLKVAIGGIAKFTVYNQCFPGDYLERNNQGQRLVKGAVQAQVRNPNTGTPYNPSYGTCAMALTGGAGATDGSSQVLALFLPNQNSYAIDGNAN